MRILPWVVVVFAALSVLPAPAEAGNGKNLLHLIGDDAQMVMVVDVADAHDGASFTTLLDHAPARAAAAIAMLDAQGIDLDRDLDTIVAAGQGDAFVFVLEGRFTADQLGKLKTGTAGKHRGVRYWAIDGGEATVLGKRVVITSAGGVKGVIDRHKKKGSSLTRSAKASAMRDAIGLVDARHDVWMVATGDLASAAGFEALSFGATFSADLALELRVQVADAQKKETLAATFEQQMPQLVAMLEQLGLATLASTLAVEWDDLVLELDATVSAAELGTLLGLLGR